MGKSGLYFDNECKRFYKGDDELMDNYSSLKNVFEQAFQQASEGKGKERHANNEPYEQQKIVKLNEFIGSNHGLIYQACKKSIESTRLEKERAKAEILGAINYLAAAYIVLERN
jgi:hypothetical protein